MTPDIEVTHSPNYPQTYSTGAKRSGALPKYRLIPVAALRVEAEAFTEGTKYEKAADGTKTPITSNWRQGNLDFFLDAADHLTAHVAKFNNALLEMMLDYQSTAYVGDGDHFEEVKATLLEELGHARANTAFLAEWLDSGAAGVQIVEEVARLENLTARVILDELGYKNGITQDNAEATRLDGVQESYSNGAGEVNTNMVYGDMLSNDAAPQFRALQGTRAMSEEEINAKDERERAGLQNSNGLLPRGKFRAVVDAVLGR